jgi:hypothetical protein
MIHPGGAAMCTTRGRSARGVTTTRPHVDVSVVHCADSWSDHPLITYEAWALIAGHEHR